MGVLWGLTSMRLPRGASVGERGGLVGGRGLSTPAQKSELRQRAMAWIRRGGITHYKQRKDRDPAPEQRGPKVVVSGGLKLAALTKAVASIMRRGLLAQDGFSWSVGLITLWQVHAAALADSVGAHLKAPLHHAVHGRRNVDAAQRRCKVDASFVGVEGRQVPSVHVSELAHTTPEGESVPLTPFRISFIAAQAVFKTRVQLATTVGVEPWVPPPEVVGVIGFECLLDPTSQ